jgi:hypothetical protein
MLVKKYDISKERFIRGIFVCHLSNLNLNLELEWKNFMIFIQKMFEKEELFEKNLKNFHLKKEIL